MSNAGIPFEVPVGDELTRRLASVLEVVYIVFNEGYVATSGDCWMRGELCVEAMRLGRMLAALAPEEPEPHGLVALMEFQASRAEHLGGRGFYVLQASIAACHARARSAAATDWRRIAELYHELSALTGSPVVELNRAVAVSRSDGPTAGLSIVDELSGVTALRGYHLLPAVRGDLLLELGRHDEARSEFERAAAMTGNEAERTLLLDRAASSRIGRDDGSLVRGKPTHHMTGLPDNR